jgi:hypothetical protein
MGSWSFSGPADGSSAARQVMYSKTVSHSPSLAWAFGQMSRRRLCDHRLCKREQHMSDAVEDSRVPLSGIVWRSDVEELG